MLNAIKSHWREYLVEAGGLGALMFATCVYATILGHPASPISSMIANPLLSRIVMGALMGFSVWCVINLPLAQKSGGHFNPAVTIAFFRLKKIWPADAAFYVVFQTLGALAGLLAGTLLLGRWLGDPEVNFVATRPGMSGEGAAFFAEVLMTASLFSIALWSSNTYSLHKKTPLLVASTVAACIVLGAPTSGTSLNPARSLAPTFFAHTWGFLWIYLLAPTLGMLVAAELFLRLRKQAPVCAKLHHHNGQRCIFRCNYAPWVAQQEHKKETPP